MLSQICTSSLLLYYDVNFYLNDTNDLRSTVYDIRCILILKMFTTIYESKICVRCLSCAIIGSLCVIELSPSPLHNLIGIVYQDHGDIEYLCPSTHYCASEYTGQIQEQFTGTWSRLHLKAIDQGSDYPK